MTKLIDFESRHIISSLKQSIPIRDKILLSRGRDGLTIICNILRAEQKRPKIIVPAFICNVVPETIVANGVEIGFYDVDNKLCPILSSVDENKSEKAKTLLFVNHFGFKQPVFSSYYFGK